MYTLPQLIALGFGAYLGAKAFAFAIESTGNFLVGLVLGRILADKFAFGPVRKQALALVSHTDCLLCQKTHHVHQVCDFYLGARPMPIPPRDPPPDPPDFGAAA